MAEKQAISLDELMVYNEELLKQLNTTDELNIKKVTYDNNTLKFFKSLESNAAPTYTFNLPEEMYLDQTKTTAVESFEWSAEAYPGTTDPDLDGKPVLVIAVKGDTGVTYSFVAMSHILDYANEYDMGQILALEAPYENSKKKVLSLEQSTQVAQRLNGMLTSKIEELGNYVPTYIEYANNSIKFYNQYGKQGSVPASTIIPLPKEKFIDATQSSIVNDFKFDASMYPRSTNPNLDGKTVLVLYFHAEGYAGSSGSRVSDDYYYGFIDLSNLTSTPKKSGATGNILEVKDDGLYVPAPAAITWATADDVKALFEKG